MSKKQTKKEKTNQVQQPKETTDSPGVLRSDSPGVDAQSPESPTRLNKQPVSPIQKFTFRDFKKPTTPNFVPSTFRGVSRTTAGKRGK